jgi:hypothetical protein
MGRGRRSAASGTLPHVSVGAGGWAGIDGKTHDAAPANTNGMGLPGIPGGSARAWRRCDAHASLRRPARNIRQAVAVVARGMARRHGNLGHPVHPARMKNDCVRQVSWLAGQCTPTAFSGPSGPNGIVAGWLAAYSCRGSRGFTLRSLLIPFRGTCRSAPPIAAQPAPQARSVAKASVRD